MFKHGISGQGMPYLDLLLHFLGQKVDLPLVTSELGCSLDSVLKELAMGEAQVEAAQFSLRSRFEG